MTALPLFDHADSYPHAPGYRARDTSREAAAAMKPCTARLRAMVLSAIGNSAAGLTPDEAADALAISILSARPRVTELFKLGLIVPTGERRKNESGRSATVWRIA